MTTEVVIYHNNEHGFAFSRWTPEAPLRKVFEGSLDGLDFPGYSGSILELIYAGCNRGSGKEWPHYMACGLRSLSVGDVVRLSDSVHGPRWYAVASFGFDEIDGSALNILPTAA